MMALAKQTTLPETALLGIPQYTLENYIMVEMTWTCR